MKIKDLRHTISFFFVIIFCLLSLLWTACHPSSTTSFPLTPLPEINGEAISFLGDTLRRPEMDVDVFLHADSLLEAAGSDYHADSTDLNAIIWYGRRLAYTNRFRDAIDVFTRGIELFPKSPELYRQRGHRFLTVRQPENAIHDLETAASLLQDRKIEVEPDDIPNKLGIPLSNLHFNIYYHLGLAWYLKADFPKAIEALMSAMTFADNPDLKVATTYWLYLSYLRSGDRDAATKILSAINGNMEIIENEEYLHQLLVFRGEENPMVWADNAMGTQSLVSLYGMSCQEEANGHASEAAAWRRQILSTGRWPSFGYLAAEADAARLLKK